MSTFEFKLPDIGEGIAEAEIVAWHVNVGERVEEDDPLADMMTDKATVEMTAPVSGIVTSLAGNVGDQIAIGAVLATFQMDGAVETETSQDELQTQEQLSPPQPAPPEDTPLGPKREKNAPAEPHKEIADNQPGALSSNAPLGTVQASPAVRQRAKALGVDLAQLQTQGRRIRHADLDAFINYNRQAGYGLNGPIGVDEQVKIVGLRRKIAENMAASVRNIPHFTYVEEIDVTKLEEVRAQLNETRGDKPRLTILTLVITACLRALPEFPFMNALYDDETGIVSRSGAVHLGIATQTDAGLMVPVIRNAESLNIWQIAAEIARLAEAARNGKAIADELSGSTLTITSLGALGGIATTPVINRPEVAIIGPNKVMERPVWRNGQAVSAKLMNLSISCDHRVIDGWDAASFVQGMKRLMEAPALLFAPQAT